jgi:plastocyanin
MLIVGQKEAPVPRRAVLLAVTILAVAGLAVSACGGGDDEAAAPPPAESPPAEDGGEATELQLAADPGGALAYDASSLEAPPGTVSIVLTNESDVPHNVAIEEDGNVLAEGEIFAGGGTRTTTADLEAGEYAFFCSVPGHREGGMEGTLTVG